ncbi:MAG: hypothetical protein C4584_02070 [Armatimonadetes bacterium]|nr:MAG: hypothetical protein C4584_02070 [Armatimonadota bacterium]
MSEFGDLKMPNFGKEVSGNQEAIREFLEGLSDADLREVPGIYQGEVSRRLLIRILEEYTPLTSALLGKQPNYSLPPIFTHPLAPQEDVGIFKKHLYDEGTDFKIRNLYREKIIK